MMLFTLSTLALLLGGSPATAAAPLQTAPADTTRLFRGFASQQYAWGTLQLRNGQQVRGYFPATGTGLDLMIPYYPQAPDGGPKAKPRFVLVVKVQWLRVRGQYSEMLTDGNKDDARLAARVQSGAVELFMVRFVPPAILTALGSNPVLSAPVDAGSSSPEAAASVTWYLRRSNTRPVLVNPATFAPQVAAFFADDRELARHVAAGDPGYRLPELESLVQQYNQRARR